MLHALQKLGTRAAVTLGRESRPIRALRPAYEWTLAALSLGRGIPWQINDVEYRIDPRFRAQLGHAYDATVAQYLSRRVRSGAVCIDVGANVGVYVLQFAKWSAPDGRVFAFEPNPTARRVLERHVAMNGLEGRVTIEASAVGEVPGGAVLHRARADGMSRIETPNPRLLGSTQAIEVQMTSLDAYCSAQNLKPDWLLIDIEGHEAAALRGARQTILGCRPDLGIVVEMHPPIWDDPGEMHELLGELAVCPRPLSGQCEPLGQHGLVALEYREETA